MSVLAKIGQTPMSELQQFLPDVWKRDDQAAKAKAASAPAGVAAQDVKAPTQDMPAAPSPSPKVD